MTCGMGKVEGREEAAEILERERAEILCLSGDGKNRRRGGWERGVVEDRKGVERKSG